MIKTKVDPSIHRVISQNLITFQMVLFTVNSDDRDNKQQESTTDFSIACQRFNGVKDVNREGAQITVQSVAFPLTWYNINADNNVVIYTASAGSGARTITLTPGYYTVSQFAALLAAAVSADLTADIGAGNSIAVAYSGTSFKYTYTPTLTAGTFKWDLSNPAFTAFKPLGYRDSQLADTTAVATGVAFESTFCVNLGYSELYIWATIPGINSWSSHRKGWGQLIAVMHPVGAAEPGQVIQWRAEWQNGFRIPRLWESVRFTLRDHSDNVVDLNGSDINITLNITGLTDGLPKAGYFRPSQEMAELFMMKPPWAEKPFLPSIYDNPRRPAGNNGLVLDPGFMLGGQMDRQPARPRKNDGGVDRAAKRFRR
jgi:hypothetical protein